MILRFIPLVNFKKHFTIAIYDSRVALTKNCPYCDSRVVTYSMGPGWKKDQLYGMPTKKLYECKMFIRLATHCDPLHCSITLFGRIFSISTRVTTMKFPLHCLANQSSLLFLRVVYICLFVDYVT